MCIPRPTPKPTIMLRMLRNLSIPFIFTHCVAHTHTHTYTHTSMNIQANKHDIYMDMVGQLYIEAWTDRQVTRTFSLSPNTRLELSATVNGARARPCFMYVCMG